MFFRPHFLALFVVAACGLAGPAHAGPSAATLRVEQDVTGEGKVVKFQRSQKRALKISVTNTSNAPLDLVVKHKIFGRSVVEHAVVIVAQGEQPLKVAPLATEQIETPQGAAVAVDKHYDTATKKMVDGSGATIMGHGVQLLQGGVVITESYDPASLKDEWDKATALTPAAPGAAAAAPATPAKK